MASEKLIHEVKNALQNEEKSVHLYSNAGKTTKNPVVRATMKFLSEWENRHAELIRKLYAQQMGEMIIFNIKTECSEDPACIIKEFFGKNMDEFEQGIQGSEDDIKVYETGLRIEQEGYKYYKKAARESKEPDAKELFEFLASEENMHYKFLEDQLVYLKNPKDWYFEEEKWTLEG